MILRLIFAILLLLLFGASPGEAQTPPVSQCVTNALAGGTADAITIPALPCSATSTLVILTATATNATTSPTLQMIGAVALPIVLANGAAPSTAAIVAGGTYLISGNGTKWFLLSGAGTSNFVGPLTVSTAGQTPQALIGAGAFYSNVNHNPTLDPAGYSTGCWMQDADPASGQFGANPAAGGAVVCSMFVDNLDSRNKGFWDLNLGVIQWGLAAGGANSQGRGIEIDITQSISIATPHDPFSLGAVVHGLEIIAGLNTDAGTTNPNTGILLFSQRGTAHEAEWMLNGVSMARILGSGIYCGDDTVDGDAVGSSFQRACIEDASGSARVLYLSGPSHTTIFDFTGLTSIGNFLVLPSGINSTLTVKNVGDHFIAFELNSGNTAAQLAEFHLVDRNTVEWVIQKDASNFLNIVDTMHSSTVRLQFDQSGNINMTGTMTLTGNLITTVTDTAPNFVATAAAGVVSAGKIAYGGTTSAASSCGSLAGAAGCVVIDVAGTTRNVPFY